MAGTVDHLTGGRTLADVVASLDPAIVRMAWPGAAVDAPISAVTIYERTDPRAVVPGAVVLAVGVAADEGDAITLLDHAAQHRAAAVVLRADELPERLLGTARALDLVVLTVPLEMEWGQLYSLLRTAMAGAGRPAEGESGGVAVGDLFAFADAVAAGVGGPVTIEDPQWRVLAYSSLDQPIDVARRQTILGRMPPPEWQDRLEDAGIIAALRKGEGVVHFLHEDTAPRMAVAVRAGHELLGSIWVAQGSDPFSETAEEELASAGAAAAVHLIAHRALEDVERRSKGTQLRELLEGRAPRSERFRTAASYTAVCFELLDSDEPWTVDPNRILSVVALYLEGVAAQAMCALIDERIWALVPRRGGDVKADLLDAVAKILDRVERVLGARLVAGVGTSVEQLEEVPCSRRTAERAVEVLARRTDAPGVAHIDDVREHAALLELLELAETRPSLREGAVVELVAHDAEHGSDLVGTLRGYLDCHGDIAKAASALSVHPNTLRYRLRRLQEIAGTDLADADARLVYAVQLRLLD